MLIHNLNVQISLGWHSTVNPEFVKDDESRGGSRKSLEQAGCKDMAWWGHIPGNMRPRGHVVVAVRKGWQRPERHFRRTSIIQKGMRRLPL